MTGKSAVNFLCPTKIKEAFDAMVGRVGIYRDLTDAHIAAMKLLIEKHKGGANEVAKEG